MFRFQCSSGPSRSTNGTLVDGSPSGPEVLQHDAVFVQTLQAASSRQRCDVLPRVCQRRRVETADHTCTRVSGSSLDRLAEVYGVRLFLP